MGRRNKLKWFSKDPGAPDWLFAAELSNAVPKTWNTKLKEFTFSPEHWDWRQGPMHALVRVWLKPR